MRCEGGPGAGAAQARVLRPLWSGGSPPVQATCSTSPPSSLSCVPLQEYNSIFTSFLAMFEHQYGKRGLLL